MQPEAKNEKVGCNTEIQGLILLLQITQKK